MVFWLVFLPLLFIVKTLAVQRNSLSQVLLVNRLLIKLIRIMLLSFLTNIWGLKFFLGSG